MTALTSMTVYEDHPYAAVFPRMPPGQFEALCASIAKEGLHEWIVLYEDKILLGRERYRACLKTGTEPRFREYEGDDPVGYVISSDVLRRHLSPSQKAVFALAVERVYASEAKQRQRDAGRSFGEGHPKQEVRAIVPEALVARDKAAAAIGISPRLVTDAKLVEHEAPDLLAEISSGALTISKAKREIRRREKAVRVAEIASRTPAPITSLGPFPVLYADPPWRYEHGDPSRAIEAHYPTLDLDEIKALKVPACDDAVLFLWARAQCSKRRSKS